MTIAIIGAGGHAKVVLDALLTVSSKCVVFDENDQQVGRKLCDLYTIQKLQEGMKLDKAHIAVGDNQTRQSLALRWARSLYTVVHPRSVVSRYAQILPGTLVTANAIVGPNSSIGQGCILNHNCVVDHDCMVGDWVHIAPGAVLGGGCKIGDFALIGAGAVVMRGVSIGNRAIVSPGAVVTKDVPDECVVGIPAQGIAA